jgi:hypothetical protein
MPDDASNSPYPGRRPPPHDTGAARMQAQARRRAAERAAARAKLCIAACDVVRRRGLTGLDVDALSGAAHLRRPTIRKTIARLDDLLDDVTACAQRELAALIADAIQGELGRNAIDTLVQAHRLYAQAQPGMYDAALRRSGRSSPEARAAEDQLFRLEASAAEACGASPEAAGDLVWCVRAVVFGAVRLEATDRHTRQTDIDRRFARLAVLLAGAALDASAPA